MFLVYFQDFVLDMMNKLSNLVIHWSIPEGFLKERELLEFFLIIFIIIERIFLIRFNPVKMRFDDKDHLFCPKVVRNYIFFLSKIVYNWSHDYIESDTLFLIQINQVHQLLVTMCVNILMEENQHFDKVRLQLLLSKFVIHISNMFDLDLVKDIADCLAFFELEP